MDIVYILGSGSVWEDNEIRFSLRSVEKNVSDLHSVFVVGECPDWMKNVVHIPAKDLFSRKWRNGYHKIKIACNDDRITSDFLLMNDDFFIIKEIEAKNYPYYYNKQLPLSINKTALFLKKKKRGFQNFSVHRPFRYNKEEFLSMPELPIWELGFSVRSFYANYYRKKGVPSKDPLFSPLQSEKDYNLICSQYTDFSVFSSTVKNPVFKRWILSQFPVPSRFEA